MAGPDLILVSSPKGGVGKTFVAANLAVALAQREGAPEQTRVALIDLDPQNGARFHFGRTRPPGEGWATCLARGEPPTEVPIETASRLLFVSHGTLDAPPGRDTAAHAREAAEFLSSVFGRLAGLGASIVVCDLPAGASPLLDALAPKAALLLHVLLADPASVALLPSIEAARFPGGATSDHIRIRRARFVLNQVDWSFPLSERIARACAARLGDRLVGAICRDRAVMTALAHGKDLLAFAPDSDAARDIRSLAAGVISLLAPGSPAADEQSSLPPLLKDVFG